MYNDNKKKWCNAVISAVTFTGIVVSLLVKKVL